MTTIPVHNPVEQADELVGIRGFRLFSQRGISPDLPPVRVMNYGFGLILSGTATERIGLQTYPVKSYSVVFTFPGQIVSYTETSPDLSFLYCLLDDEFMANPHLNRTLIDSFGFFRAEGVPVFDLPESTGTLIQALLEKIKAESATGYADYDTLIRLYLHEIFILINRAYSPNSRPDAEILNRGQVISRHFKELVSQHFLREKQVQAYADLLSVSPRHLSEIIKTNTGYPPSHWILTMEMLEARFQLKYSTQTVAEVAYNIGYQDAAYFSKVFRKVVGMAPIQYRQG
jgi:AraC family transcriptional regulator, transcriptional activator of pobA